MPPEDAPPNSNTSRDGTKRLMCVESPAMGAPLLGLLIIVCG